MKKPVPGWKKELGNRRFEVIVDNVGVVYSGSDEQKAERIFAEYKRLSHENIGRVGGEVVVLSRNGSVSNDDAYRPLPWGLEKGSTVYVKATVVDAREDIGVLVSFDEGLPQNNIQKIWVRRSSIAKPGQGSV